MAREKVNSRRRDAVLAPANGDYWPSEPAGCTLAGGDLPGWLDSLVTQWSCGRESPTVTVRTRGGKYFARPRRIS